MLETAWWSTPGNIRDVYALKRGLQLAAEVEAAASANDWLEIVDRTVSAAAQTLGQAALRPQQQSSNSLIGDDWILAAFRRKLIGAERSYSPIGCSSICTITATNFLSSQNYHIAFFSRQQGRNVVQ